MADLYIVGTLTWMGSLTEEIRTKVYMCDTCGALYGILPGPKDPVHLCPEKGKKRKG
jgi:hypothetical protein